MRDVVIEPVCDGVIIFLRHQCCLSFYGVSRHSPRKYGNRDTIALGLPGRRELPFKKKFLEDVEDTKFENAAFSS